MTNDLTWRQGKVFRFLRDYTADHGYAPSIREIGEAVGLASSSSVNYTLTRLENKGYIRRIHGRQALAIAPEHAGLIQVDRKDLYNLLVQVDGWVDVEEGYLRLKEAAGLL